MVGFTVDRNPERESLFEKDGACHHSHPGVWPPQQAVVAQAPVDYGHVSARARMAESEQEGCGIPAVIVIRSTVLGGHLVRDGVGVHPPEFAKEVGSHRYGMAAI